MIGLAFGLKPQQTAFLLALASAAAVAFLSLRIALSPQAPTSRQRSSITVPLPPPNLLRPINPEEALRENAGRSFATRADSAAAPFKFTGDAATKARAVECLAQAAYYEAAADGPQGERAVVQVVLNRVRHPGFPPSICGVVYQGSGAPGCQFTFTCDGALARVPPAAPWFQARQIALEELSGKVFAPVGHATHYHADYVLPYWADSLDKSGQVGHQIFYRLKGVFGDAAAFTQRYARAEPPPPSAIEASLEPLVAAPPEHDSGDERLSAVIQKVSIVTHPRLLADSSAGFLIADDKTRGEGASSATAVPVPTLHCDARKSSVQLHPLAPDDLGGSRSSSCTR
jgi:spore germination cell wall hydrolase CwlJ-like protein